VKNTDAPTQDRDLETRSKAAFDASVSELQPRIRTRLRDARLTAVEQASSTSRSSLWWIPALSTAAIAGLVLWLTPVLEPQQQPLNDSLVARTEDMSLLMTEDNLDMIEEMEFYVWLGEGPGGFDAPPEVDRGAS
jgi:hypothetical protein